MGIGAGMYGLSGSGMDVDDMVKKMMTAQQNTYDKMYKNKVTQQWKKTEQSSFYKTLMDFRAATTDFRMQSTMAARSGKSSDESVVTITANGEAVEMTHEVAIKSLASSAYLQSAGPIERDPSNNGPKSILLEDLIPPQSQQTPPPADTDVAISFVIRDNMNKNPDGTFVDPGKVVSYTYGEIKADKSESNPHEALTLNDLASDINDLGLNVQASYDSVNDSFSLSNRKGGDKNTVSIGIYDGGINNSDGTPIPQPPQSGKDTTATLFNRLHLAAYTAGTNSLGTELKLDSTKPADYASVAGVSANVTIDGRDYTADTNQITASGVIYKLHKKSASTTTGGVTTLESTKITVNSNPDKIVENVKKFVETYNKLLDSINGKIYEASYKEYKPLTNDEKKAMSEDEIKRWEEKAKSGLLANDSILKGIVDEMRTAVMQPIEGITGKYNSAAALGITVGASKDHGKLQLTDAGEKKLREALVADPDAVWKVFGKQGDPENPNVSKEVNADNLYKTQGFVSRLSKIATTGMNKINDNAGFSGEDDQSVIGTQIESITTKMTVFSKKMSDYEARLYKQFNAMEVAIAQLNSQASFVSQYGGGA